MTTSQNLPPRVVLFDFFWDRCFTMNPWLTWNSIPKPGWRGTRSNPSASAGIKDVWCHAQLFSHFEVTVQYCCLELSYREVACQVWLLCETQCPLSAFPQLFPWLSFLNYFLDFLSSASGLHHSTFNLSEIKHCRFQTWIKICGTCFSESDSFHLT